jgi:hypothetical protein
VLAGRPEKAIKKESAPTMEDRRRLSARLAITGWKPKVIQRPVSLVDLLKRELAMDLKRAKAILDEIAESGSAVVEAGSYAESERLRLALDELGVLCERVDSNSD